VFLFACGKQNFPKPGNLREDISTLLNECCLANYQQLGNTALLSLADLL